VAFRNHEDAKQNIRAKLEVLRSVTKSWGRAVPLGVEEVERRDALLPLLPGSIRQFNAWHTADLPAGLADTMPRLRTNANQTLRADATLLANVQTAIAAIRSLRKQLTPEATRQDRVAALTRRARLAEAMRSIAERELIAAMRVQRDMAAEISALKNQLTAIERESRAAVDRLEGELGDALKSNAELVKQQQRIKPLRPVK